jgi:hypothetical protein
LHHKPCNAPATRHALYRARYQGVAVYRASVSLLPFSPTTQCSMIQASSLVFIARPCPPLARVSGTLDEAGDPRLWLCVAGRLSVTPPHRERETMPAPEICFLRATELVRLLRAKELSAREVMEAHLAQIERANPEVNAIVTLTAERAQPHADPRSPGRGMTHASPTIIPSTRCHLRVRIPPDGFAGCRSHPSSPPRLASPAAGLPRGDYDSG